ncbi:hypothetical protein N431DRAFT_330994 [Stipitochalara longipes BDJ]|nr:hypothetical protein N431DRAFT_330994 [Stipitochalara longipes BDJ]
MSEYWKSTPKYWCKHCKTYIRDTKLEKTNHEATPKHQGNLKRFLRDLHRGHEKDEKDKERAKNEVARLNGLVTGGGMGAASSSSSSGLGRGPTPSIPKAQITPAQRKQQLAQLAEMGISIPDEFRPEMAMAGEWQVTSERVIEPEDGEKKPDALALGVRKRILDEDELEAAEAKKRRWGSTYKSHPVEEDNGDLDALLGNVTRKGKEPAMKTEAKEEMKEKIKVEPETDDQLDIPHGFEEQKPTGLKREPSDGGVSSTIPILDSDLKQEGEGPAGPGVVFKKRKAKNIRQK